MKLLPLSEVSSTLHAGVTLPWGVRDGNGALLLARGHTIQDDHALEVLLERGVFVDAAEVASAASRDAPKREESMTTRWTGFENRLGTLLKASEEPNFLTRVRETTVQLGALADGNVDLLIFLILRHDHSRPLSYGTVHSLHSAALCSLLSRRLGWPEPKRYSLIAAALTMNISMIDLQGTLAVRVGRPTAAEQEVIHNHPLASAKMLRDAGLDDSDWLSTVEQHHEAPKGTGYPLGVTTPSEMARILRFVDSFTAKHSPRAGRTPQPAHKAARDLFTQSAGDPMAALIIKELGIYPPGCYVRLASDETGIVIQRGATANAPVVMAITNKHGDPLAQPSRRDTALAATAVVSTVAEELIRVRVSAETLYDQHANR